MPRTPDRLSNQIEATKKYLRTARGNYMRAYKELTANPRKRLVCPFEQKLKCRRFDDASKLLKLAELCLKELRNQRALSLAPFQPGDQILGRVHTTKGFDDQREVDEGDKHHIELLESREDASEAL